ncbi:MAG: carboxymuconolactone decarboxylase family protein [Pseudonocardiaceae bacterium]
MEARMKNPVFVVPEARRALKALGEAVVTTAGQGGVTVGLLDLVYLRASQINGCSICLDMHARDAKKVGESDERIAAVAAWRDTPYFTEAERAALALTEAVTRLPDRSDPVPDDVYAEAAKHYDEQTLAALILAIAYVNAWNRINATTRQVVSTA